MKKLIEAQLDLSPPTHNFLLLKQGEQIVSVEFSDEILYQRPPLEVAKSLVEVFNRALAALQTPAAAEATQLSTLQDPARPSKRPASE